MKNKFLFRELTLLLMVLISFASCKKETPPPTASFTYTVDGNKVTFIADATDYNKFEWNFGDGSYISTIPSPTHAYPEYGKDYTATLTVLGKGGEISVTNTVTIPKKTLLQLLTGGIDASSSKKWRLNVNAPSFLITAAMPDFQPVVENYPGGILAAIGLSKVYGDSFEFKGDGTLTIHPNGDGIFAGYVYCIATQTPIEANPDAAKAGLAYAKPFAAPTDATFAINEGKNFKITTTLDGKNPMEVIYNNVNTLSFTNKGFLGILDFSSECIIKQLSDTQMEAAIFISAVKAGLIGTPNMVLHLTFEVAP